MWQPNQPHASFPLPIPLDDGFKGAGADGATKQDGPPTKPSAGLPAEHEKERYTGHQQWSGMTTSNNLNIWSQIDHKEKYALGRG